MEIKEKLTAYAAEVDAKLAEYLKQPSCGEVASDTEVLWESMRYSIVAGGKRIRPALTLLFCEELGGRREVALPYACAVEMIHTYSLIHDDLPAMDNDDLRRGKPTNHKVFGEARAILAGDALLTLAFETAAGNPGSSGEENLAAIRLLAGAVGASGMVGGQEIDLEGEEKPKSYDKLLRMHRLKTGALIEASVLLGVLAAGRAGEKTLAAAAQHYADAIGLTFQIVDDILDYTASSGNTGKTSSDLRNGKTTFLSFMPPEEAFDRAVELTAEGIRAIAGYDSDGSLSALAKYLLFREK